MKRFHVLALVVIAGACASAPRTELRSGRYAGSTSEDVAITIDVGGSHIRVNNRKARLKRVDDNRNFVAQRMKGQPAFSCHSQAGGKELRCEVRWPDRTEIIELMRE